MSKNNWEMVWRLLDTKAAYLVLHMIYIVGRKFFPEYSVFSSVVEDDPK